MSEDAIKLEELKKKYNNLKEKLTKQHEILKHSFIFQKSIEGLKNMTNQVVSLLSVGLCRSINLHDHSTKKSVFDFDYLHSFACEAWVRKVAPDFFVDENGLGNLLFKSLDDILADASYFVYFLFNLSHAVASKNKTNKNDNHEQLTRFYHQANSIVSLFHASMDDSFVNPLSLISQLYTKSKGATNTSITIMGKLLPGGVTNSYIEHRSNIAVRNVGNVRDIDLSSNIDITGVCDNCSINYKPTSCENTTKEMKCTTIWTNCAVILHYPPPMKDTKHITKQEFQDNQCIQLNPSYAPSNWKLKSSCNKQLIVFGYDQFPKIFTENEMNHREILESYQALFVAELQTCGTYNNGYDLIENTEDTTSNITTCDGEGGTDAVETSTDEMDKYKYCEVCEKKWPSRSKRKFCDCLLDVEECSLSRLILISREDNKNHFTKFRIKAEYNQRIPSSHQCNNIQAIPMASQPILAQYSSVDNDVIFVEGEYKSSNAPSESSTNSSLLPSHSRISRQHDNTDVAIDSNVASGHQSFVPPHHHVEDNLYVRQEMKRNAMKILCSSRGQQSLPTEMCKYVSLNKDYSMNIYHPLPPIIVNPCSHAAAAEIIDQYCEMANVIDFPSEPNEVNNNSNDNMNNGNNTSSKQKKKVRYFMDFIADAGVASQPPSKRTRKNETEVDHYETDAYTRVVFRLGPFHVYKNFLETVMKVIKLHVPASLLCLCGYESISAQEFILSAANIRRSYDWIHDCLLPALINTMFRFFVKHVTSSCRHTPPQSPFEPDGNISMEVFEEYCAWACEVDFTFKCYYSLVMDILLPLTLLKTAIRTSNFQAFDCARLKLLPLCFAFHNTTYGPRHVMEIVMLYHKIHIDVLRHYAKGFSFDCKGVDERMEEHNKDVISMMSKVQPSENKIRSATLLQQQSCSLETVIINCLSHKESNATKKQRDNYIMRDRTHVDQTNFVKDMQSYLYHKAKIFEVTENRKCCKSLANSGSTEEYIKDVWCVPNILEYGTRNLSEWSRKYIDNIPPHSKFPVSVQEL